MKLKPTKKTFFIVSIYLGIAMSYSNAASYSWDNGGLDYLWKTSTNWSSDTVPTSSDTAAIGDTTSTRTITYSASDSSTIASSLSLAQTTAGVSNILKFIRASSSTTAYTVTLGSGLTLGTNAGDSTAISELWVDASMGQSSSAGGTITLSIGSNNTLHLCSGGILQLTNYYYSSGSSGNSANFTGSIVINSGSKVASSLTVSGTPGNTSVQNTISGSVTLYSGGALTIGSGYYGSSSSKVENRLIVSDTFTMDGGTLTFGNSYTQLILNGTTNVISGGTISGTSKISLSGENQSLETNQSINTLIVRLSSSSYTTGIKTIATTSISAVFDSILFGASYDGQTTTLKLGSDITAGSISQGYGAGSGTTIGSIINLNSNDLTLSSSSTWTPGNISGSTDWYITNTGSSTSYLIASSFDFNSAGQVNIGYGVGSSLGTVDSGSTDIVVLKATGNGANVLSGGGSINPTSKFWYTGNGGSLASTRTIGKLEVGNGYNGLLYLASSIAAAGDIKVTSGSYFSLSGYSLTLSGAANLTGKGYLYDSGSVLFASGATGGISPGGATDTEDSGKYSVGTLSTYDPLTSSSHITSLELASTSTSWFDIASTTSYDVIDLGGATIVYNGALYIYFMNSSSIQAGDAFTLVSSAGSYSGTFSSISSNTGWSLSYDYASGTLSVLAIPEPSVVELLMYTFVLCAVLYKFKVPLWNQF